MGSCHSLRYLSWIKPWHGLAARSVFCLDAKASRGTASCAFLACLGTFFGNAGDVIAFLNVDDISHLGNENKSYGEPHINRLGIIFIYL